jgi:hypothetical protein
VVLANLYSSYLYISNKFKTTKKPANLAGFLVVEMKPRIEFAAIAEGKAVRCLATHFILHFTTPSYRTRRGKIDIGQVLVGANGIKLLVNL